MGSINNYCGRFYGYDGAIEHGPCPVRDLEDLIEELEELDLQQGLSSSLNAKLNAAFNALDDSNENNDVAAVNALQAFINAVEAQRGKKINDSDADMLIANAQAIIDAINS